MITLNATGTSRLVSGPVRKIGVQSRSITGTMPDGNRYGSSLEREAFISLIFDTNQSLNDSLAAIAIGQPVTIKVCNWAEAAFPHYGIVAF